MSYFSRSFRDAMLNNGSLVSGITARLTCVPGILTNESVSAGGEVSNRCRFSFVFFLLPPIPFRKIEIFRRRDGRMTERTNEWKNERSNERVELRTANTDDVRVRYFVLFRCGQRTQEMRSTDATSLLTKKNLHNFLVIKTKTMIYQKNI